MWRYRAKDASGVTREGLLAFPTAQEAVQHLRDRNLTVIDLKQERNRGLLSRLGSLKTRLSQIGTVPLGERALFFRQMAALTEAGIVLGTALEVLEHQCSCPPLTRTIAHLRHCVNEGTPLSEAMKGHREFDQSVRALILSGEESGLLNRSLDQIALYLEQREGLRKRAFSAMTYPGVVLAFSLAALWLLVTRVIPQFQQVFQRMDIAMPPLTARVFGFSSWMIRRGPWLAGLLAALALALAVAHRFPWGRRLLDPLKLRCPLWGKLLRLAVMARSLQTLGILTASGVPILRALDLSAQAADNYEISQGFRTLADAALKGQSLGTMAQELEVFPPMTVQMIKVGEESGRLDAMILKAASWYRQDLEERIKKLTALVEPVLTLSVGLVVALVAVAIFSPVVSAIHSLSR